jgi:MFS family permease
MGGTVLAMGGLALVHDPVLLVVLVFLAGFFAESYRPAVTAMLTDLVSPTHRGATYALQMSVLNLGAAISPVLGGLVAGSNHYSWLFWIHCAGALALGVVTWRWLPETVPPRPAESTSFRALLKDPPLRFFYGGVLLVASGFFQLLTALPVYLKEHLAFGAEGSAGAVPGQGSPWWLRPELQCGLLLFLKGALIVLIAVRLTRKLRGLPHKELLALGSLLSGLGLALIGCSPQLRWAVGGVVLLTLGEILVHPSALAYLAARVPAELRARAMGLFALTQGCAFFLAPVWAGVLLPWLGPAWFWCIAAITTAAAAACFRAVPTESPAQLVE